MVRSNPMRTLWSVVAVVALVTTSAFADDDDLVPLAKPGKPAPKAPAKTPAKPPVKVAPKAPGKTPAKPSGDDDLVPITRAPGKLQLKISKAALASVTLSVDGADLGPLTETTVPVDAGDEIPGAHARGCPSPGRMPGGHQRGQVPDRAPRGEDSPGSRRHTHQVGDPTQGEILGINRAGALQPRPAIDRGGADNEVEHRGGIARGARDEGQIARVVGREATGGEIFGEEAHRLQTAEAFGRDRLADPLAQLRLGERFVQRRREPDALLGVGNDLGGERLQVSVFVGVVRLADHTRSLGHCRPV